MYTDAEKAKMKQRIIDLNGQINDLESRKSDYYNLRDKVESATKDLKLAKNNIISARMHLKENYSSTSNEALSQNINILERKSDEVVGYINKLNGAILSEINSEISYLNSRINSLESEKANIRRKLNS